MKTVIAAALVSILLAMAVTPLADDSDAAGIIVTDGIGNVITLDGPADRIITVGTGITATVIGVGALDKISVWTTTHTGIPIQSSTVSGHS